MRRRRCANCDHPVKGFRVIKKCSFPMCGSFRVALEKVRAAKCSECEIVNYLLGEDGHIHLNCAVVRELIDFPVPLNGDQFQWIVTRLVNACEFDEIFAEWIGFKAEHEFMVQNSVSFEDTITDNDEPADAQVKATFLLDMAKELVAWKLGFEAFDDLVGYCEQGQLPEELGEKVRDALRMVKTSDKFPTQVKFLNGEHLIFVDMSCLLEPAAQKEDPQDLREINEVFRLVGLPELKASVYDNLLNELDYAIHHLRFTPNDSDEQRIVGCSFCTYDEIEQILYANRMAFHPGIVSRGELIGILFEITDKWAIEKGANVILLETPVQAEARYVAEAFGYTIFNDKFHAKIVAPKSEQENSEPESA